MKITKETSDFYFFKVSLTNCLCVTVKLYEIDFVVQQTYISDPSCSLPWCLDKLFIFLNLNYFFGNMKVYLLHEIIFEY